MGHVVFRPAKATLLIEEALLSPDLAATELR
jgi:hypothetical protein